MRIIVSLRIARNGIQSESRIRFWVAVRPGQR